MSCAGKRQSYREEKFGLKEFIRLLGEYGKILPVGSVSKVPEPNSPGPTIVQYTSLAALHAVVAETITLIASPLEIEQLLLIMWDIKRNPITARQRLLKDAYEKRKLTSMGEVKVLDEGFGLDVEMQAAELMAQLNDREFGYVELVEEVERRLEEGLAVIKRPKERWR